MYYLLLTLLILDAILLTTVVLLQAGKGGGLAAMGAAGAGSDSVFGSRQATSFLTNATWWTGSIFLVLSFILSILAGPSSQSGSILREGLQTPATSSPALPTVPTPLVPAEGGADAGAAEPAAGGGGESAAPTAVEP